MLGTCGAETERAGRSGRRGNGKVRGATGLAPHLHLCEGHVVAVFEAVPLLVLQIHKHAKK
jgi:hypothetical protein